jgi:hypothetical protein
MFHVLQLGGNDDAVVMATIAWRETRKFICLRIDEGDASGKPLEAAEDADHIFSVTRHSQSLHVRPNALDLLLDLPGRGIDRASRVERLCGFRLSLGQLPCKFGWIGRSRHLKAELKRADIT